jgi:AraC-like DNA-binding protein
LYDPGMTSAALIFLCGTHLPRCRHHVDKVFDGYYTLQYMEPGSRGGLHLEIGGREYGLKGRWFWSCHPGPRIRFWPADENAGGYWEHRYVAFRDGGAGLLARWATEGLFPIAPQRAPGHGYGRRFDALLKFLRRHDTWAQRRAVHALEGLLLELAEHRATTTAASDGAAPERSWLPEVLAELQTAGNAGNLLSVNYAAIADGLGISIETFRRQFRAAVGVSPHAYVVQSRVAAAKRLLAETHMPLKKVAVALGYHDVFFFSRQFRQVAGVTPGMYRRSVQG